MRPKRGVQASIDCTPAVRVSFHTKCLKNYVLLKLKTICLDGTLREASVLGSDILTIPESLDLPVEPQKSRKGLSVRCGTQNFRKCSEHRESIPTAIRI